MQPLIHAVTSGYAIGFVAVLVYALGIARATVKFIAADIAHYWQNGDAYTDEDFRTALMAGAVRALGWPLLVPGRLIADAIFRSAERNAFRMWDKATPEAHVETPGPGSLAQMRRMDEDPFDDRTVHIPRHRPTAPRAADDPGDEFALTQTNGGTMYRARRPAFFEAEPAPDVVVLPPVLPSRRPAPIDPLTAPLDDVTALIPRVTE
jgi:hypothetical protein